MATVYISNLFRDKVLHNWPNVPSSRPPPGSKTTLNFPVFQLLAATTPNVNTVCRCSRTSTCGIYVHGTSACPPPPFRQERFCHSQIKNASGFLQEKQPIISSDTDTNTLQRWADTNTGDNPAKNSWSAGCLRFRLAVELN